MYLQYSRAAPKQAMDVGLGSLPDSATSMVLYSCTTYDLQYSCSKLYRLYRVCLSVPPWYEIVQLCDAAQLYYYL